MARVRKNVIPPQTVPRTISIVIIVMKFISYLEIKIFELFKFKKSAD